MLIALLWEHVYWVIVWDKAMPGTITVLGTNVTTKKLMAAGRKPQPQKAGEG